MGYQFQGFILVIYCRIPAIAGSSKEKAQRRDWSLTQAPVNVATTNLAKMGLESKGGDERKEDEKGCMGGE